METSCSSIHLTSSPEGLTLRRVPSADVQRGESVGSEWHRLRGFRASAPQLILVPKAQVFLETDFCKLGSERNDAL